MCPFRLWESWQVLKSGSGALAWTLGCPTGHRTQCPALGACVTARFPDGPRCESEETWRRRPPPSSTSSKKPQKRPRANTYDRKFFTDTIRLVLLPAWGGAQERIQSSKFQTLGSYCQSLLWNFLIYKMNFSNALEKNSLAFKKWQQVNVNEIYCNDLLHT